MDVRKSIELTVVTIRTSSRALSRERVTENSLFVALFHGFLLFRNRELAYNFGTRLSFISKIETK